MENLSLKFKTKIPDYQRKKKKKKRKRRKNVGRKKWRKLEKSQGLMILRARKMQ